MHINNVHSLFFQPALTDVKPAKPVPPPRTKKPNTQCTTSSTVNSVGHFSKETVSSTVVQQGFETWSTYDSMY